jgi:hypothetical protein
VILLFTCSLEENLIPKEGPGKARFCFDSSCAAKRCVYHPNLVLIRGSIPGFLAFHNANMPHKHGETPHQVGCCTEVAVLTSRVIDHRSPASVPFAQHESRHSSLSFSLSSFQHIRESRRHLHTAMESARYSISHDERNCNDFEAFGQPLATMFACVVTTW